MVKENGVLVRVDSDDIELLRTEKGKAEFWKDVKEIGEKAFSSLGIVSVDVPKTVRVVHQKAFFNCLFLRQVFINSPKTEINRDCFYGCNQVSGFYLRKGNNVVKVDFNLSNYGYSYLKQYDIYNLSRVYNEVVKYSDYETLGIYLLLAESFGCFCKDKITLQNGTLVNLSDYATDVFLNLFKNAREVFSNIPRIDTFKQTLKNENLFNFLQYLKNPSNNYNNFKTFINCVREIYNSHYDLGDHIDLINNFDRINQFKTNEVSYAEAYRCFLNSKKYQKAKDDRWNIFEYLQKNSIFLNEDEYKKLVEVVKIQKQKKVPEHVLGYPLQQTKAKVDDFKTSKERIQTLQQQTANELQKAEKNVKFTYELLSKHDLVNAYIGKLKTSCCASLISKYDYGMKIAEESMLDPKTQNIVVRDSSNEIVGKMTFKVLDPTKSSAPKKPGKDMLINSAQINSKYKGKENSLARENMYETFLNGIENWVAAYNNGKSEEEKIRQVNIGAEHNAFDDEIKAKTIDERNPQFMHHSETWFEDALQYQKVLLNKSDISKLKKPNIDKGK